MARGWIGAAATRNLARAACVAALAVVAVQAPGLHAGSPVANSPAPAGFWTEELARGLNFPAAMAWLPDGDILIAERQGGLRLFHAGKLLPAPVAGLPPAYLSMFHGYKDIALDPDFRSNRLVYLLFSEGTYEKHGPVVYRGRLEGGRLAGLERIFRSPDTVEGPFPDAGRLAFLPDGTLLVTLSCGYGNEAVEPGSYRGKVIRIARDGSIPRDNPFAGDSKAVPGLWTMGHRTPLGLFVDPADHAVWEVEPGPRGGDELNRLAPGKNYGWPTATWGFNYDGKEVAPRQFGEGVSDPAFVWTPSVSPSAVMRYHGTVYPAWNGDLFVATLTGRAIERLRFADGELLQRERLLTGLKERIRDVRQGPDGYLYVLTDHRNGRLLRLVPGAPTGARIARVARSLDAPAPDFPGENFFPGDAARGRQAFLDTCAGCHSIGTEIKGGTIGPDLDHVYLARSGTRPGFAYSAAMRGSNQTWDGPTMIVYLQNPAGLVPGTAMAMPPLTDGQARRDIVAFLQQQGTRK